MFSNSRNGHTLKLIPAKKLAAIMCLRGAAAAVLCLESQMPAYRRERRPVTVWPGISQLDALHRQCCRQ
jgi:hypothetical protein